MKVPEFQDAGRGRLVTEFEKVTRLRQYSRVGRENDNALSGSDTGTRIRRSVAPPPTPAVKSPGQQPTVVVSS